MQVLFVMILEIWWSPEWVIKSLSFENSYEFWLQWQTSEKSLKYLIYRWFVAVFFVLSLASSITSNLSQGFFSVYFIYITHLNLVATVVMSLLSACLASIYFYDKLETETGIPITLKLYWFLWNQCIVFAMVLDTFFWIKLYGGNGINLEQTLVHITNCLVLVLDLFVVKHPSRFSLIIYTIVGQIIYVVFTLFYSLLGGVDRLKIWILNYWCCTIFLQF